MHYFESTLTAMKKLLDMGKEYRYAVFLGDCIADYQNNKSTDRFRKGFSQGGLFESFAFRPSDFDTEEQLFWATQLFGGMVAMAAQLARFESSGRVITIDFMRKHFGHPAEVVSGSKCGGCGYKEITAADIDRYITPPVVAAVIVDGLEEGSLLQKTEELINGMPALREKERAEAKERAANTGIAVSDGRAVMKRCPSCGGTDIVKCRFLKSLKTRGFVALSR